MATSISHQQIPATDNTRSVEVYPSAFAQYSYVIRCLSSTFITWRPSYPWRWMISEREKYWRRLMAFETLINLNTWLCLLIPTTVTSIPDIYREIWLYIALGFVGLSAIFYLKGLFVILSNSLWGSRKMWMCAIRDTSDEFQGLNQFMRMTAKDYHDVAQTDEEGSMLLDRVGQTDVIDVMRYKPKWYQQYYIFPIFNIISMTIYLLLCILFLAKVSFPQVDQSTYPLEEIASQIYLSLNNITFLSDYEFPSTREWKDLIVYVFFSILFTALYVASKIAVFIFFKCAVFLTWD